MVWNTVHIEMQLFKLTLPSLCYIWIYCQMCTLPFTSQGRWPVLKSRYINEGINLIVLIVYIFTYEWSSIIVSKNMELRPYYHYYHLKTFDKWTLFLVFFKEQVIPYMLPLICLDVHVLHLVCFHVACFIWLWLRFSIYMILATIRLSWYKVNLWCSVRHSTLFHARDPSWAFLPQVGHFIWLVEENNNKNTWRWY